MTTRLSDVFAKARSEQRAALIGYLPAGFPTPEQSVDLIRAMIDGGVDAVEVGLPYSDPLIDGPVIQAAVDQARSAGTTTEIVFDVVGQVSGRGAAVLVMSYWNPIERYGVDRFARRLVEQGGVGVIAPDLTPEEAGAWAAATEPLDVDRIYLVAPSSTDARIRTVVAAGSGFVYAASTMGVTGARASVSGAAGPLVARVREHTDLPIAVGLGVSSGDQAAEVAAYADGVIVGSAFVRRVLDATSPQEAVDRVRDLARELADGVRR